MGAVPGGGWGEGDGRTTIIGVGLLAHACSLMHLRFVEAYLKAMCGSGGGGGWGWLGIKVGSR